jgi:hypothetical protein
MTSLKITSHKYVDLISGILDEILDIIFCSSLHREGGMSSSPLGKYTFIQMPKNEKCLAKSPPGHGHAQGHIR